MCEITVVGLVGLAATRYFISWERNRATCNKKNNMFFVSRKISSSLLSSMWIAIACHTYIPAAESTNCYTQRTPSIRLLRAFSSPCKVKMQANARMRTPYGAIKHSTASLNYCVRRPSAKKVASIQNMKSQRTLTVIYCFFFTLIDSNIRRSTTDRKIDLISNSTQFFDVCVKMI